MQTYNLFRRQNEEDLYCAVPEDVPVPRFVTDERWEWAQSLDVSQLSGFDAGKDAGALTRRCPTPRRCV